MVSGNELARLSLTEVGALIAAGQVSPVEVTRNCLGRLDRYAGPLGATTAILHDQALADARRAEREILAGEYRGPLHGVPVGIKDLADVAGAVTTAGSTVFGNEPASVDAGLVRGLRKAGAVIACKLNCDEFAYHPTGATSQLGPSRNPWNTEMVSGGSSGGTGSAVAAGLIYGGLGTDTGGSIRLPAALCGLVGIKPTYGRVSLEGVRLLSPSFDTPGPMARSTRDAAVMLRAMADPVTDEAIPTANRIAHLTSEMPVGLEGLRVGVPSNYFFDDLDPEIERIALAAVDALAILGGDLVQVGMPSVPDLALSQRGILTIEAYHNVISATGGDVTRVNPTLRARLKLGLDEAMRPGEDSQVTLGRLRSERDDALAAYRRAAGTVDVLVAPVLKRPPPRIDAALTDYHWMPDLTRPFNATHQPVVAVPCGWTADGLPVGLQIVAAKYRERIALRVAYAYEQSDHAPERRWPDLQEAA